MNTEQIISLFERSLNKCENLISAYNKADFIDIGHIRVFYMAKGQLNGVFYVIEGFIKNESLIERYNKVMMTGFALT